ncbi:two-component system response regulator [Aromatoleum evansii]|uniref:two-component system response regulator n=1 Tax=Aromatoleum evansii TaxID=59406 RepID=UPI00145DECC4|nr:EAL domain-containing protein [Aromatoleum evansii]NMG27920.1 EAL domain-containing protein [Aromatoleum evansii]
MAKILVIDDHAVNRELIVALAGYEGHEALEAGDGAEGLAIVRAQRPQLVICDILMPNVDGYEFVRRLRADPEIAHTRVIFHTANYHEREVRHLAGILGVSRILVKPCDPEVIVRTIAEVLAEAARENPPASDAEFEREHLRVLTDKLAAKAEELERRAADLASEVETRKLAEAQLRRVLRARKVMAECNRTLVRATDERRLLAEMCRFLVELGNYGIAWVSLAWHDADCTVETVAAAGEGAALLKSFRFSWGDNACGNGPVGEAVRTREPQVVRDIASDPRVGRWREAAIGRGYQAAAVLPLVFEHETFGVLCIVTREKEAFDADELELLGELADDIAYGIHTLRARVVQQRTEETLRLRNRAIDESINAIVISAADREADNPVLYVNPAFTLMTGYAPEEIIGRNTRLLIGNDWDQPDIERLREAVRRGRDARVTLRCYRKDGSLFWNEVSLASMHDPSGRVSHFISIFNDLTDRKRYEAELEQQANHDALTGLANRNLLNDRLQQAMIRAQRNAGAVAVMLLDIDRFKLINDSLGHAVGDELICEVARRLAACVRQGDTVARLGGDEFMIVMSELWAESDAASLAAKVLQAVSAPMKLSGHEMVVTGSLGVALFPRDGESAALLVKNADVAMYRAKEQGRNDFRFYAPEMNARMLERLELENGLRRALEQDELELHYQPKVELANGRVVGAEALIRWRHPVLGMVSPADFIPLAEETGLIVPIGEWVINTACRQLKAWREEGLTGVSVAVNVSARQFQQEDLVGVLGEALRASEVPARQLHLEVTESGVMSNPERTIVILRTLKDIGVLVSLDDFGTGYSSLNYLKRFLIDSVKIDQSFVADLTTSSEDAAIARMVISLAHSLNQTVVAEGVETEAQLDFLRRHRCDEMQGFLCSRPIPAVEFANLVRGGACLPLPRASRLH